MSFSSSTFISKAKSTYTKPIILKIYLALLTFFLLLSIYKDVCNCIPMPTDLRNRIVGARIMEDGFAPYFYIWENGGPVRYYDDVSPDAIVSRATATPFFHWLLMPIADLQQVQINVLWFIVQYLALFGTCFFAVFSMPAYKRRKASLVILAIAVLFTYTFGWRNHLFGGQNYIFIPLLLSACYCFIKRSFTFFNALFFCFFAVSLILIRPVSFLFFVPLMFFPKLYFKWGMITVGGLVAYAAIVLCSPLQKLNWVDYFKSIPVQIKSHQNSLQLLSKNNTGENIGLKTFEGVDLTTGNSEQIIKKMYKETEITSLFILYNSVAKKPLSINAMTITSIVLCVILLLPLFIFRYRSIEISVESLFLLGFCIYDVFIFCQPIAKGAYSFVEFILPLVLIAGGFKNFYIIPFALILIGLIFNIFSFAIIPIRHGLGEGLIVIAFLLIAFRTLLFADKKWEITSGLYWL